MAEWMSIEKERPGNFRPVWLWAEFWYAPTIGYREFKKYRLGRYRYLGNYKANAPTHWKPIEIPDPPKEEK